MNQPNPNPNATRNFVGGLLLVPLLHSAFTLIWFGISFLLIATIPFFNRDYNFFLLGFPIFGIGITQIAYLIPFYYHFARKQRHEVGKGIMASAIVTIFINGTCFAQMGGIGNIWIFLAWVGGGAVLATAIGLLGKFISERFRSQNQKGS